MPGSSGQVMYFCKPADAAVPLSGSGGIGASANGAQDVAAGPAQLPSMSPANQTAYNPAPELPIAPPQLPPQQWAPANQPNGDGRMNLPLPQAVAQQPLMPPPPFIPPNPSNAAQPRAGMPINQYAPNSQPAVNPMAVPPGNMPPDSRPMVQPDPRVLSPEFRTTLPPREVIFQMRNPEQLEKWVLEETRANLNIKPGDTSLKFPEEEKIGGPVAYQSKTSQYPAQRINFENTFLVHRRLHFEELNAERYGWDFGILQPFISTAYFYKDCLLLPYSLASGFNEGFWDSSSGKCLPGSPTPYTLYPPGLSITGGAFEGVVVTGLAFFIP
jgi:hypothetical protein